MYICDIRIEKKKEQKIRSLSKRTVRYTANLIRVILSMYWYTGYYDNNWSAKLRTPGARAAVIKILRKQWVFDERSDTKTLFKTTIWRPIMIPLSAISITRVCRTNVDTINESAARTVGVTRGVRSRFPKFAQLT
jgi:hypothetical protein